MMARLEDTFARLAARDRKALVAYLVAGDPSYQQSLAMCKQVLASGNVDILELGVPFSDPMAEGTTIQQGHNRALEQGMTPHQVVTLIEELRADDQDTPIVLMGYANTMIEPSLDASFLDRCQNAGADAVLIVDLPSDTSAVDAEISKGLVAQGFDIVRLVAPTTRQARLQAVIAGATGYVYCVTYKGVTGGAVQVSSDLKYLLSTVKSYSEVPVVAGFGIRTGADASALAEYCDGVVVGSALVDHCKTGDTDALLKHISLLRDGLDNSGS